MKRLFVILLTAAIIAVSASSAEARISLEAPRHCPRGFSAAAALLGNQPQIKSGGSTKHPPPKHEYPTMPVARLSRYEGGEEDLL